MKKLKSQVNRKNKQGGFIALTATLILIAVLMMLMVANSTSSFFSRFDVLGSQNKRVSLGLSEACSNVALLKLSENYYYTGGDKGIPVGDGFCSIDSVNTVPGSETSTNKTVSIKTSAQYPSVNGSWTTNIIQANIHNPAISPTDPAPTCNIQATPTTVIVDKPFTLQWSTSTNTTTFTVTPPPTPGVGQDVQSGTRTISISTPGPVTFTGVAMNASGVASTPCTTTVNIQTPPSAPSCADTVMMLDRTGSMFPGNGGGPNDIPDEKTAAMSLVDLYSGVSPHPKLGIGQFGDISTGLNAEIIAHLTNDYSNFSNIIKNGLPQNPISYTNLSAAIDKGHTELDSEKDGMKKVLILISDGGANVPCAGKSPCGGGTNSTATTSATASANNAKSEGVNIYTIHFGNAGQNNKDQNFLASLANNSANDHFMDTNTDTGFKLPTHYAQNATGDTWQDANNAFAVDDKSASDTGEHKELYYGFGINGIPSSATIKGIEVDPITWVKDDKNSNPSCKLAIDLSWDGGNVGSWTNTQTKNITNTKNKYIFGGANDTWGQYGQDSWGSLDFNDKYFRVRVQDINDNSNCSPSTITYLDSIQVKIYYSNQSNTVDADAENADGDNFFIAPTSADMENVFTTIGKKVCPALAPACSNGLDDDLDGLIDSKDPACHTDGNANNIKSYDPSKNDEWTPPPLPDPITPPSLSSPIKIGSWTEILH